MKGPASLYFPYITLHYAAKAHHSDRILLSKLRPANDDLDLVEEQQRLRRHKPLSVLARLHVP